MRRGGVAHKERAERARERQEVRITRTSQQQLDILDEKLGVGVGAVRERRRLTQEINNHVSKSSDKVATSKSQRRKEKAERHARRKESGN